jgi:predicted enzyme related to lactoylglutathione lyase
MPDTRNTFLLAHETQRAYLAVAFFPRPSKYFPVSQPAMGNFQVDDLNGVLEKLSAVGVSLDAKREECDYGRFGWFTDPERGTRSRFGSHQGELARRATRQRIMVGCQAAKIVY